MDNKATNEQRKRRNVQLTNEYNKRIRKEIDISGGRSERLAKQAEYQRKYRARKKEERLNQPKSSTTIARDIPTRTTTTNQNGPAYIPHATSVPVSIQQPSTYDISSTSSEGDNHDYNNTSNEQVGSSQQINKTNISFEEYTRDEVYTRFWGNAMVHFNNTFMKLKFNHACHVCDRLWTESSLKEVPPQGEDILRREFPNETISRFMVCSNCCGMLRKHRIPTMSRSNGFAYPPRPDNLPHLDPVGLRLISPRLPFMQIRRLRREGSYGIVGQIVNVPVDVHEMVTCLPRELSDDATINVNIKKNLFHNSVYLSGYVNKGAIKSWLEYLIRQPLYKLYNIKTDFTKLEELPESTEDEAIEEVDVNMQPDSELIAARQSTFMWNEDECLTIAPGQHSIPLNVIFDKYAEELSFPHIYYGVGRSFKTATQPSPYTIATSEIRRSDRRGVTPDHILYMAMKIMRLRVADGMKHSFRCTPENENITRADLENLAFVKEKMEKNLSFLKSIPNSVQYWAERKRDLFAMIRQLGKPTAFLTLSANEVKWPRLIEILHSLNNIYKDVQVYNLTRSMRSTLVNEDPVTCCIYFKKLLDALMGMLKAKKSYNPFGKYRVLDFFVRIEFQHRGSPHAHILLWLDNDPTEHVSENMPRTLQMMTDLCSVNKDDLLVDESIRDAVYGYNVHKHTFTCTKRGEKHCRFNIPHWPLPATRIFLPMPADSDGKRERYQKLARQMRNNLEVKNYDNILHFLIDNNITSLEIYYDIIRASIIRPTVIFQRDMTQIMTNTFNPFISSVLQSNSDLQIILDEYSCAAYVVEYVNKSNRGISHLHRELLKIQEETPEITEDALMKKTAVKMLNAVEMPAQEAAWYLLRQPMSYASRDVYYVPTVWPHERQKARKRLEQMDEEGIDANSTDVWTKGPIQRYEDRPNEMKELCLADFLAWYTSDTRYKKMNDIDDQNAAESNDENEERPRRDTNKYKLRKISRVLRSRTYDTEDVVNYKREMVLLYVPFRNEAVDILDRNKFIELYDQHEAAIMEKRKEYEKNINIQQLMEELRLLCAVDESAQKEATDEERSMRQTACRVQEENNDEDIHDVSRYGGISIVGKREGVMPKQQFCEMMRTTNLKQRALLLEFIHRIHDDESDPIQIFFTGPAGCGKTYVLKLIMEILNRYTMKHTNSLRNAYVACASTGKAAAAINGITAHSAFRISLMRTSEKPLASEMEQTYRAIFHGVAGIIIDEISMLSTDVFQKIDARLKQITGIHHKNFGGLHIVLCGDLRQLPPVRATPVFKCNKTMVGGPILWQSLNSYMLTQVMRQSDINFSTILTKIGTGLSLNNEEKQTIQSRFRTSRWCDENVSKDAVRLFHDNRSVDEYNSRAISNPDLISIATDIYMGHRNNDELVAARTKLHKLSVSECSGYPYSVQLAMGYPYMITTNIDVEDGIVNGAICTLMYIEKLTEDEMVDEDKILEVCTDTTTTTTKSNIRLWVKFSSERIGRRLRMRSKPHVLCKLSTLKLDWTPIQQSSVRISLHRNGTIKCRRVQFPIVPACAITIHKSQGASFETVVFQYDKKQEQQLVYVAMSRATSLEGLYMTNSKDDFTFHHGGGDNSSATRDIRDEYARLAQHPLTTLTDKALTFMNTSETTGDTIIIKTIGHNVQSLLAHKEDVETDQVMNRAEYLLLNETWMDEDNRVELKGYELAHLEKREKGRTAGGAAIYRSVDSLTTCEPILPIPEIEELYRVRAGVGDICLVGVNLNGRRLCVMGSVYIHPKMKLSEIELLFFSSLARYGKSILNIIKSLEVELDVPIALMGDFNVDVNDKNELTQFLAKEFGLVHHTTNALPQPPTTLGGTCIDHVFLRCMNTECIPYVSYFSYHRPLLNKLLALL